MHKLASASVAVLDWLNGGLVHARGGQREIYRPLAATFTGLAGYSPIDLVHELRRQFGIQQFYLADLDMLRGGHETGATALGVYILKSGWTLWWDRGWPEPNAPNRLGPPDWNLHFADEFGAGYHPVLGTESCCSPAQLFERIAGHDEPLWTLSLDLFRQGKDWMWFGHDTTLSITGSTNAGTTANPKSPHHDAWSGISLPELVSRSVAHGVREMIVLNLADVGSTITTTGPLLEAVHCLAPQLSIIAGGGVSDDAGLLDLLGQGAERVLLGTWLWSRLSQTLPRRA
jgi:uncharacterized protein related to proFAR isomerase